MPIVKTVLATLAISLVVCGVTAAGVIYTGVYNVAATSEHWPITRWALSQTVHRSIEQQASGIDAPELGSEDQLLAGAANFDAMCSGCHAPPGGQQSIAARGMYPRPPELDHAAKEKSPSEIFWVIKHGIKASGMPAWGASHSDEQMWAMTAFVEQLPNLSPADYRRMLQTAEARGIGHHHARDGSDHHDEPGHSHDAEHAEHAGQHSTEHDADDEHTPDHHEGAQDAHLHPETSAHAHA